MLLASECSLFGFASIIPEVIDRKILNVYQVPTHHNGVINLSISKNPFKHDTLNINPDMAQLCLDYACQSLMLPFDHKIKYQLPSINDLLNLHAFPNNLSYQKHVIDGRKIIFNMSDDSIILPDKEKLESLDIQFLSKDNLIIEPKLEEIKKDKVIFFNFDNQDQKIKQKESGIS